MELSPIILFVYNRLQHLQKTIVYLLRNHLASQSVLYVFSDGPKDAADGDKVTEVRDYIKTVRGFKEIIISENETNLGLAYSIIKGVTQVINLHGKVIVLEDDQIVAGDFLSFLNDSLEYFRDDDRIFSISGYTPKVTIPVGYHDEIFLFQRTSSNGWGTWVNRWNSVDWNVSDFETFIKDKKPGGTSIWEAKDLPLCYFVR